MPYVHQKPTQTITTVNVEILWEKELWILTKNVSICSILSSDIVTRAFDDANDVG